MLENFLISFAASAAWSASHTSIVAAAKWVANRRPDLERRAQHAKISNDPDAAKAVLQEAVGEIVAAAGSGTIQVDGAIIAALKSIQFDHGNGTIWLDNVKISAASLLTGGNDGAVGTTVIGSNSVLDSRGTSIHVGSGASITITGNANIKQT